MFPPNGPIKKYGLSHRKKSPRLMENCSDKSWLWECGDINKKISFRQKESIKVNPSSICSPPKVGPSEKKQQLVPQKNKPLYSSANKVM